MARSQNPNCGNSQFFIMFEDGHFLNGQYTVWGRVTEGMEHVDAITRGEPPAAPDRMISVRVAARRMIRRGFLALAAAAGLAGGGAAQDAGDVLVIEVDGRGQGHGRDRAATRRRAAARRADQGAGAGRAPMTAWSSTG